MLGNKYDFKGIKKVGARALILALSSTGWGQWLLARGFEGPLINAVEVLVNWLANRGLMVLNIGAIFVEGEFDQKAFDKAMESALEKMKLGQLTEQEMKAIDEEVIKAFRRFAIIANHDSV